ncbi:MAG: hypothetical protein ACREDS_03465, partial [Limisphaerales bacterium]
LGDGRPAAQYLVCVSDDVVNKDLESSDSKLKKYLPKEAENDRYFAQRAAAIFGGVVCSQDCSLRFNQWVLVEIPKAIALLQKPANLSEPTLSMAGYLHGITMWLLKAEISRQPYP